MEKNKLNSLSTADVYNLIDRKISEVNISINRLTDAFNNLEIGRLSELEKTVSMMKGQAMMIPTIISIALGIFFFLMNFIFNKL